MAVIALLVNLLTRIHSSQDFSKIKKNSYKVILFAKVASYYSRPPHEISFHRETSCLMLRLIEAAAKVTNCKC